MNSVESGHWETIAKREKGVCVQEIKKKMTKGHGYDGKKDRCLGFWSQG